MLDFIIEFVSFLNENEFYIPQDKIKRFIDTFYFLDIADYDQLISLLKTCFSSNKTEYYLIEEYFIEFLLSKDAQNSETVLKQKEKRLKKSFENLLAESEEEIEKINKQIEEIANIYKNKEYEIKTSKKREDDLSIIAKKYLKKCPEFKDFLKEIKDNGQIPAFEKYFENLDKILKQITKKSEEFLMSGDTKAFDDMCKLFSIIEKDKKLFKSVEEKRRDEIKKNVRPFEKEIKNIKEKIKENKKEIENVETDIEKIINKEKSKVNRKQFLDGKNFILQTGDIDKELFDKNLKNLDKQDYIKIYNYIKKNLVKFKTKITRNINSDNKHMISMKETILNACKTGGIPLKIFYEKPKMSKANIVLVLDVSGSCKSASKLMLTFIYLIKDMFPRGCSAFVFVNNLFEVTPMLELPDIEMATDAIFEKVQTKGIYSNYYLPLKSLWENYNKRINKDSIVIFIGDARNNKNDSGEEYIKNISRKAKKCFFLNTDDFEKWDQGDSIASKYLKYAKMYECKNTLQLLSFIENFK